MFASAAREECEFWNDYFRTVIWSADRLRRFQEEMSVKWRKSKQYKSLSEL